MWPRCLWLCIAGWSPLTLPQCSWRGSPTPCLSLCTEPPLPGSLPRLACLFLRTLCGHGGGQGKVRVLLTDEMTAQESHFPYPQLVGGRPSLVRLPWNGWGDDWGGGARGVGEERCQPDRPLGQPPPPDLHHHGPPPGLGSPTQIQGRGLGLPPPDRSFHTTSVLPELPRCPQAPTFMPSDCPSAVLRPASSLCSPEAWGMVG